MWWSLTALASGGLSPAHAALGTVGPAFLSFLLLKVGLHTYGSRLSFSLMWRRRIVEVSLCGVVYRESM